MSDSSTIGSARVPGMDGSDTTNAVMEEYVKKFHNDINVDHERFNSEWRKSTQRDQVRTMTLSIFLIGLLFFVGFIAVAGYAWKEKDYAKARQDIPELLSQLDQDRAELVKQEGDLVRLRSSSSATADQVNAQVSAVRAAEFQISNATADLKAAPGLRDEFVAKRDKWNRVSVIAGLALIPIFGSLGLFLAFYRSNKRLVLMQIIRLNRAEALAVWQQETDRGRKLALRKQMEVYQRIVINYTRSSRQVAIFALLTGFGLVAAVIITGLATSTTGAQSLASAVVGTASAGLGAFLGSTVIDNLKQSQEEMLAFFRYPMREDRIIAAKEIAAEMANTSGSSEPRMEIVRGILNDNARADRV